MEDLQSVTREWETMDEMDDANSFSSLHGCFSRDNKNKYSYEKFRVSDTRFK